MTSQRDPQRDEDEVFRQIVASFDEPADGDQPWPERENVPAEPTRRVVKSADEAPGAPGVPGVPGEAPARAEGDDEGHYEPPPPPPLPKLDVISKVAWLALFGGPAYLLIFTMFGWDIPNWAAFCAVGALIGGFVTLVVRMGDDPPRDSGWDDGAVV
ncbi:hypothetical protein [Bailinhaonella thermotolerans]|uniref:DUF2530 domain-containing protein n=1 Tax=Bailinhaonella thermotolerans TaxID=1070861 RepID=A0A3A4ASY0_9ACTN|nr:hypothetical protein [Bailinhaonella thermotolerans]RJL31405.1 hypothetical protein D5H75_20440 [Bailinhaonella thermotolerans]